MRYLAVLLLFGIVCRVSCSIKYTEIKEKIQETKEKFQEPKEKIREINEKFREIKGKYYYIEHDDKLNWFNARDKCRGMDAHLVSIQNYGEWDSITDHLTSCKSYWVDLRDVHSTNDFTSDTSGRNAPFLKWSHGQPRCRSGYDCVKLRKYSHKMKTKYCSQENHYICEANRRPVQGPVTSAPIVHYPPSRYPILDMKI